MLNFNDIFVDDTKYGMKIPKEKYLSVGLYPVIDQSKEQIAGYTDESEGIYCDVPAIIFGDHTRIIKYIDVPFFLGADGTKLLKIKDNTAFNCKYLYYALSNAKIPNTGYNRHFKWLKELSFNIPSIEKQREIADLMDIIVNLENLRKKQLEKLELFVKSRFIEMFGDPLKNERHWEIDTLENLVTDDCSISYGIVQTGEPQENGIPVFRPVDIVGHNPTIEELKKTTVSISNKYRRTILTGRDLLITVRANIADTFIANKEFKGCNVGRGIVPLRVNENVIKLEFLKAMIDFDSINQYIKSKAKGITLIQLNMVDLRLIPFILPPVELQIEFIKFLQQVDKSKFVVTAKFQ